MFFGEKIGLIGRKERVSFSSFDSSLLRQVRNAKIGRAATVDDDDSDDSGGHGGSYYGFNFSFLNPPMALAGRALKYPTGKGDWESERKERKEKRGALRVKREKEVGNMMEIAR